MGQNSHRCSSLLGDVSDGANLTSSQHTARALDVVDFENQLLLHPFTSGTAENGLFYA